MTPMGKAAKSILEPILDILCEHPEEACVKIQVSGKACLIEIRVDPSDYGKVIGQQGKIAKALRVILQAFAGKYRTKFLFEILANDV